MLFVWSGLLEARGIVRQQSPGFTDSLSVLLWKTTVFSTPNPWRHDRDRSRRSAPGDRRERCRSGDTRGRGAGIADAPES